ncbi:MAG: glutamine--fructose-6-phosphate aminotransferase, partial [Kiritimatiellia bacterium]|nr:glutamine--fructose-6-phosphate aminotransferase [Kiritimatiellia bacterium]
MCGIIGYTGRRGAADILLSGLKRMEYRGYDSAGIALHVAGEDDLVLIRRAGKIAQLESALDENRAEISPATLGIGHTRWATHGPPTEANAHPHLSRNGRFAIAHNGIIDNYLRLREKLSARGYTFRSETDSEVIAHLIEEAYDGDLRAAVANALEKLEGTYGIVVISPLHPGQIVAARRGSPLAVGVCRDETLIASDVSAIVNHTDQVIFLDDGDLLTATGDAMDITSQKNISVSR